RVNGEDRFDIFKSYDQIACGLHAEMQTARINSSLVVLRNALVSRLPVCGMISLLLRLDPFVVLTTLVGVPRFVAVGKHHIVFNGSSFVVGHAADTGPFALRAGAKMLLACLGHCPAPYRVDCAAAAQGFSSAGPGFCGLWL